MSDRIKEEITDGLLARIKDRGRILLGDEIGATYQSDTLGRLKGTAEAVVFPVSTKEVEAVMAYAHGRRIPVTPRGAGTNLVGSTVPLHGGIVLDLSRMDRILELDEENLTVTVEAGVLLKDLQALVEGKGLFYPPDPGEKAATIGGNVATNAGGMRAVKYGVTRDYVRGLKVVKADGTVVSLGSKNVKDSSGLSLKSLLIGSEGTLGVITECTLRLVPKPACQVSVLVPFGDLETGIRAVHKIIKDNSNPVAIEFVEREVVALGERYTGIRFPFPQARAYIILSYDGVSRRQVERQVGQARAVAEENGAEGFLVLEDEEKQQEVWKVRGCLVKAVEAVSEQEPVDIVVPIGRIAGFMSYIHELEETSGVQMAGFGHAGDGNVHLCVIRGSRDQQCWDRKLPEVLTDAYEKSLSLGGLPSGEHGIGIAKQPYFLRVTDPVVISLMNGVKRAFDPENILNPGKSYQACPAQN